MPSSRMKKNRGLTGADVIKKNKLRVKYVRDDGTCWWYVVAAAYGKYKVHPTRHCIPDPSEAEKQHANEIRQTLAPLVGEHITKCPDYDGVRGDDDFFGAYGGPSEWQELSKRMHFGLVCWDRRDEKKMKSSDYKWELIFNGISKFMNAQEISNFMDDHADSKFINVSWSRAIDDHFDFLDAS